MAFLRQVVIDWVESERRVYPTKALSIPVWSSGCRLARVSSGLVFILLGPAKSETTLHRASPSTLVVVGLVWNPRSKFSLSVRPAAERMC